MGFKRKAKHFRLKFADEQYEGFECELKSLNMEDFLSLTELSQDKDAGAQNTRNMLGMLAGALVSWNLENEDGSPVPASLKGLKEQDLDFTMDVIVAWMDAMAGVKPNLPPASSSGDQFLEASIKMEAS